MYIITDNTIFCTFSSYVLLIYRFLLRGNLRRRKCILSAYTPSRNQASHPSWRSFLVFPSQPVDAPLTHTFPGEGGAWAALYARRGPLSLAGRGRLYTFILRRVGGFSKLHAASVRGSKHKGTEYACHFNRGISVSSVPEQKDCAYISESGLIPAQAAPRAPTTLSPVLPPLSWTSVMRVSFQLMKCVPSVLSGYRHAGEGILGQDKHFSRIFGFVTVWHTSCCLARNIWSLVYSTLAIVVSMA